MTFSKEVLVYGAKPFSDIGLHGGQHIKAESQRLLLPPPHSSCHEIASPNQKTEQNDNSKEGTGELKQIYLSNRIRLNWILTIFLFSLLFCSGYLLRDYIQRVLVVAENQDDLVVFVILVLLYFLVSMPFAWGYILINVATGYLYGMVKGTVVTFVTATTGVLLAHHLIKCVLGKYIGR